MSLDDDFQFADCSLEAIIRPVRRLSDSLDAFLAAGKRPGQEVAVILHRVPAVLDSAHVGFVFADVMGKGHCGARICLSTRSGWARNDGATTTESMRFASNSHTQFYL